jgi:hypothetical protein
MHALAALLTPDFHASNWTDQEIGFALGRNVLVVPILFGTTPYGFIGEVQGPSCSFENPSHTASIISSTLLANSATRSRMRTGIASAFAASESYAQAIALSKIVTTIDDFTEDEISLIRRACVENNQVFNAAGVLKRINDALGASPEATAARAEDIPW